MTRDEMEARRLNAAGELTRTKGSQANVARKYGVTRTTASRWAHTLSNEGMDALHRRTGGGRPSKLTPGQLAQVARFCKEKQITSAGLVKAIEKKFGVHYHKDHACRLLRRLRGPRSAITELKH